MQDNDRRSWPKLMHGMPFKILGINHRTAPVEIREKVAFEPGKIGTALEELTGFSDVDEMLIVSTCNRTELYGSYLPGGMSKVRDWLVDYHDLPDGTEKCLYALEHDAAVNHTFAVACGLDSAVLGEPQILGQMKDAYRVANDTGTAGPILHKLFQRAFSVAKQVRTDTDIGSSPVSVAYASVDLARRIFADFSSHTAMLVGAGETIELTARHLKGRGIGRVIVANRSLDRAQALAHRLEGFAIGLDDIHVHLAEVDMIICATASPTALIKHDEIKTALKERRSKPVFIADLAVPRNVESSVADLPDAYLYTVDDLQNVITENLKSRKEAARQARQIIEAEVAQFSRVLQVRGAAPTIRAIRSHAGMVRESLTLQAHRMLDGGRDPDEVIDFLAHTLTNKLIHRPSASLRRAGEQGDDDLLRAARRLFDLEKDVDSGDETES
jgi:glutamyl-tRNA reductase